MFVTSVMETRTIARTNSEYLLEGWIVPVTQRECMHLKSGVRH